MTDTLPQPTLTFPVTYPGGGTVLCAWYGGRAVLEFVDGQPGRHFTLPTPLVDGGAEAVRAYIQSVILDAAPLPDAPAGLAWYAVELVESVAYTMYVLAEDEDSAGDAAWEQRGDAYADEANDGQDSYVKSVVPLDEEE